MRAQARQSALVLFVAVALASLVLDWACDHGLRVAFRGGLPWLRELHLVPLAISAALYVACGPGDSWKLPRGSDVKRGWLVIPIWLALFGLALGVLWVVRKDASPGDVWIAAIDLMFTHLVAQELLFRGALYELGNRLWPLAPGEDAPGVKTALATSLVFGLSQLQYFPTLLASTPWWQALRAVLIGLVIVVLRGSMKSLWAGAGFHALNNVLVFR